MGSTFGSLSTTLTALYAQRRGLDVTGQNIANANT
ncbi:MAG: flagellar basal body protein, partial [Actinomycetes bacterium]